MSAPPKTRKINFYTAYLFFAGRLGERATPAARKHRRTISYGGRLGGSLGVHAPIGNKCDEIPPDDVISGNGKPADALA